MTCTINLLGLEHMTKRQPSGMHNIPMDQRQPNGMHNQPLGLDHRIIRQLNGMNNLPLGLDHRQPNDMHNIPQGHKAKQLNAG